MATALIVLLGGCAGDEEPTSIDGRVDILPADDAKRVADQLDAGKNGAKNGSGDDPATRHNLPKGDDPTSNQPKGSKAQCAAAVSASNAVLTQHVLALFPAQSLRRIEKMKPADTENCDPAEGPDFGGVESLWKGMTGAQAIELLEKQGWKRHDPPQGPPAWVTQKLKPTSSGDLNLEPDPKFVITFTADRAGRQLWIDLTQDGLRAGIE